MSILTKEDRDMMRADIQIAIDCPDFDNRWRDFEIRNALDTIDALENEKLDTIDWLKTILMTVESCPKVAAIAQIKMALNALEGGKK